MKVGDKVIRKRDGQGGTIVKVQTFRTVLTVTVDYGYPIPIWDVASNFEFPEGTGE